MSHKYGETRHFTEEGYSHTTKKDGSEYKEKSMIEKLGITPPQWKANITDTGWSVVGKDCLIATAKKERHTLIDTHERQDRDARLIAAAPEMLKALINELLAAEVTEDSIDVEMQGVIEKATGRTWAEVRELIENE